MGGIGIDDAFVDHPAGDGLCFGFAAEDGAIGLTGVGDVGIGEDAEPLAVAFDDDELAAREEVGDGTVPGIVGICVETGLADEGGEGAVFGHLLAGQRLLCESWRGAGEQQEGGSDETHDEDRTHNGGGSSHLGRSH
jgi:hypothetical protein